MSKLDSYFESILNNWFQKKNKLESITSEYLNDLYTPYFTINKLVNSIRNIEGINRIFEYNGKNTSLVSRLKTMLNKIPDELLNNLKIQKDKIMQQSNIRKKSLKIKVNSLKLKEKKGIK